MLRIPQTRYAAARGLRVGGNSSISSLRGFGSSSLLREEGFMAGDGVWVKSPRDINQHLDKYIVGQEKAKKTLSVAVFNHYHRIVHSREQAQAARDRESAAVAAAESLAEAEAELESSKKPETVIPTPVKRRKTRDTAAEEQEQRRIESRVVEPDPTKIHEPSTWTGRNFYTARYPPSQSARAHEETESSTLLGRLSGAFTPSFAESLRMPFTRDDASGKHQTMSSYEESQRENKSKEAMEDEDIDLEKSNVLMLGPTGSGKTLLARTLARILDVPFASSDATSFTQAGYVGEDVESAVGRLLKNAEYDVARTEIGIIHIDEVDKLARRGGSGEGASWGGRDVGGEGVQQALLKLLEGTSLTLQAKPAAQVPASQPPVVPSFPSSSSSEGPVGPKGPGVSENWQAKKGIREGLPQHGAGGGSIGAGGSKGETFTVDTTNILFILSGAFVGMEQVIARRTNKGSIGFNAVLAEKSTDDDEVTAEKVDEGDTHKKKDLLSGLTSHDLVEYGFIPEFVGRVPVLAPLHPLSLSDLMRILTEPKNAVIKQQRKLFSRWGCELQFSDNALKAIAKEAVRRGGSARHLKSVISDLLLEANYESPGSSVRYAAVTEAVVLKQVPVLYFSRGQKSLFERALADDTLSQSDPQTVQDTYSGPNESTYHPAHNTPSDEPEPVRAFGQLSKSRMDRKNGVYGQRRLYHASAFRSQQPSQKNKPNRPNPGKPKSNAKSTKRRQAIASQDLRSTRSATRSPVMQCIAYSSAERYDLLAVARELNRQEVPFTLAFEQDRTDQAIVVSGWNFGLGSAMNARSEEAINLAKLAEEAAKQVDVPVTTEPSVYPNGNSITDTAIYDQGRDGEIWIFKSGSFVTWGMSLAEGRTFIREVIRNKKARIEVGAIPHHDIQTEEVDYVTDPSEETRIKGNLILLGRPPALHSFQQSPTYASFLTRYTFSVALARSSALALVEAKLNAHLESVGKVPGLLETTGTQPLKRKEVIRKIGELMVLREAVNFRGGGLEDTPEIYWSEPQLESYFDAVSTEFEMEDRIETINQKIDYASEVQSTLRALLTEGSAHRMEVIIIALIAVEVVLALIREGPELMHSIVNLLTGMDVVSKQFAIPTAIAALSPFSSKSTWAPASSENPLPIAYHVLSKPLPYQVGLDLQNSIIQARLQARRENPRSDLALQDVILLLEHTPTYTTGRRDVQFGEADSHPEQRKIMQSGAQFYYTKRGGQVTYHGPGQLVGYPLIDLQRSDITTRCYVSYLQDILASYAREDQNLSVLAPHPDDHVGVFANASEKLASIGIHMRHRISSHGFAINVTEEPLSWFNLVTACGLNDVRATSIQKMLSSSASATQPTVRTVAEDLMPYFSKKFGRDVVPLSTLSQSNAGAEIISRLIGQAEKQAESVTSQSREVLARTHISQPS